MTRLNVEVELDIAPQGFGPFTYVGGFARIQARFDCLWSRACGLMTNAHAYGDRIERLPDYLRDGKESQFIGSTFSKPLDLRVADERGGGPALLRDLPGIEPLFALGPGAEETFGKFSDYQFYTPSQPGSINGRSVGLLGPVAPRQFIDSVGLLADEPFILPAKGFVTSPLGEASGLFFPSPGLRELLRDEKLDLFDQNFRESELQWNRGASQQDEKELRELYLEFEMFDGRLWLRMGKQTIVWGKTEIFRSQDQFNPTDISFTTLGSLEDTRIPLWAARGVWSFYDVGPLQDVRLELAVLLDDYEPQDLGDCGEPFAPLATCAKSSALLFHGLLGIGPAGELRPPAWWNDTRGLEAGARLEFRWNRFAVALTDFYGFADIPFIDVIFNYERNVDPRTGRPRRGNSDGGCDPEGIFGGDTSGCLASPLSTRLGAAPLNAFGRLDRVPAARANVQQAAVQEDIRANLSVNQSFFHPFCAATEGFAGGLDPALAQECAFSIFGSPVPVSGFPINQFIGQILAGSIGIANLGLGPPVNLAPALAGFAALVPMNPGTGNEVCPPGRNDPLCAGVTGLPRAGEGAFGNLPLLSGTSLGLSLTAEQQALLGCGPFYGSSCDDEGVELMNAEASALIQSFVGFDGTPLFGFTANSPGQPATLGFSGGPVCTRFENGRLFVLPGCRGPEDPGYDPVVDGDPIFSAGLVGPFNTTLANLRGAGLTSCPDAVAGQRLFHPFTCEPFRNELAALSFNLQLLLVLLSSDDDGDGNLDPEDFDEFDSRTLPSAFFGTDGQLGTPVCAVFTPQYCSAVRAILGVINPGRNDIRAAGNPRFGRRDFLWQNGQELLLRYAKRNVLGLSVDFAEDYTKTNWGIEFTWLESVPAIDRNSRDGITDVDQYNLTISMDRPTFVNFLNPNRTFLINSQWFVGYVPQHTPAFSSNGPWNILTTLTFATAYFQDRLLVGTTLVYDFQSNSGGVLPAISYRFTERFSASFSMTWFFGRSQARPPFLVAPANANRVGEHAYKDFVENGLALVRERDDAFVTIRWTF